MGKDTVVRAINPEENVTGFGNGRVEDAYTGAGS